LAFNESLQGYCENMGERDLTRERITLEDTIKNRAFDFSGTYLAACDLHSMIRSHPWVVHAETISTLEGILKDSGFAGETQSFFLYREAANALISVVVHTMGNPLADQAFITLQDLLGKTEGNSHRASTEALGSLPLSIRGPDIFQEAIEDIPRVNWHEMLYSAGIAIRGVPGLMGRSLVADIDEKDKLLVVKLASGENAVQHVHGEATWMEHLSAVRCSFPVRFNVPMPIKVNESYVFSLHNVPVAIPEHMDIRSECFAMAFVTHKDYFKYPNEHRSERRLSMERFREVMFRNSWLLGRLTAQGIVHSAPIPLFHNRVQRTRRADNGRYEWHRGGRLDRWLHSCSYPNFGITGIRDFEHFTSFKGLGRELYLHIGTQILSLLLTTGSYFRNKDVTRLGFDEQGKVVDTRDLFDEPFMRELVCGIFLNYYKGFAERDYDSDPPFHFDVLTSRMIEEMGVDRHMEEVLRVVDQSEMSDTSFEDFLRSRGYTQDDIGALKRGENDIVVHTGPHLGGFNERISLPELIESVGAMSALCIAGKYWEENNPHGLP
jgi:hypothetical protein